METWSTDNPDHLPIMIMIEAKEETIEDAAKAEGVELPDLPLEFVDPLKMNEKLFGDLEDEILSVIDKGKIITPDDVRGDHETLSEAVENHGWPALDDSRGKFLFSLVNTGKAP